MTQQQQQQQPCVPPSTLLWRLIFYLAPSYSIPKRIKKVKKRCVPSYSLVDVMRESLRRKVTVFILLIFKAATFYLPSLPPTFTSSVSLPFVPSHHPHRCPIPLHCLSKHLELPPPTRGSGGGSKGSSQTDTDLQDMTFAWALTSLSTRLAIAFSRPSAH